MPKGASGTEKVSRALGGYPDPGAHNFTLADRETMAIAARVAEKAVKDFPGLKGSPYANMEDIMQADFKDKGTLAYYERGTKNIVIGNHVPTAKKEYTVAHEIGHAVTVYKQPGFRSADVTVKNAYTLYKSKHPYSTISEKQFVGRISPYATKNVYETVAEAFADFSVNRGKAKEESMLVLEAWVN